MMKNFKNTNGITLVSLIITIVVLLILAIVSIRLIMNSGIIDKAEKGTQKYSAEEIQEKIKIAYAEYKMSEFQNPISLKQALKNSGLDLTDDKITGEGPWTIAVEDKSYILSNNGALTEGSPNNSTGNSTDNSTSNSTGNSTGTSLNSNENMLFGRIINFSTTYADILGGSPIPQKFIQDWENLLSQIDLNAEPCTELITCFNSMEQMMISQNVNSANKFDQILPQVLTLLNSTCSNYGFIWSRDNSTRIWTYNIM